MNLLDIDSAQWLEDSIEDTEEVYLRTNFRTNNKLADKINGIQQQRKMTRLVKFLLVNYFEGNLTLGEGGCSSNTSNGNNCDVEKRIASLEKEVKALRKLINSENGEAEEIKDIGNSDISDGFISKEYKVEDEVKSEIESKVENNEPSIEEVDNNTEVAEENSNSKNKNELFDMFKEFL